MSLINIIARTNIIKKPETSGLDKIKHTEPEEPKTTKTDKNKSVLDKFKHIILKNI